MQKFLTIFLVPSKVLYPEARQGTKERLPWELWGWGGQAVSR